MLVVEPRLKGALAIARGADKDRAEVDLCEMQPLLERMHGAGLILGAAADLDFAPAGLGIQSQQCAVLHDLNPAAGFRRIVSVYVQADDFRAAEASGISE